MSPIVSGAGVELEYEVRGDGPALLLIHDLASDHNALLAAAAELTPDARLIAYSRRGYAGSSAPEPYAGTTVQEQAEDAAHLLESLAPSGALAVGEGFGALIALDLLLRHGRLVHGAVLTDPPLLAFVPDATRRLAEQRGEIEEAVRTGGPAAGVDVWLAGRASSADRDRARASARAFFADYAGLASWPVTRRELRSLAAPVVVLSGPRSEPHVVAAAEALAGLLPQAERRDDGDLVGAARALLKKR